MANGQSDCKWAEGDPDPTGLFWCSKMGRMVNGKEKPICESYEEG